MVCAVSTEYHYPVPIIQLKIYTGTYSLLEIATYPLDTVKTTQRQLFLRMPLYQCYLLGAITQRASPLSRPIACQMRLSGLSLCSTKRRINH